MFKAEPIGQEKKKPFKKWDEPAANFVPDAPADVSLREWVRAQHKEGRTWKEIAAELNDGKAGEMGYWLSPSSVRIAASRKVKKTNNSQSSEASNRQKQPVAEGKSQDSESSAVKQITKVEGQVSTSMVESFLRQVAEMEDVSLKDLVRLWQVFLAGYRSQVSD